MKIHSLKTLVEAKLNDVKTRFDKLQLTFDFTKSHIILTKISYS